MSTDNLVPDLGSVKRIAEAKGLRGELIARALTAFASNSTSAPRAPTPEELEAWTNANPGVRVPGSKVLANGWRQRLEWDGAAWVNAAGAPSVDDAALITQLGRVSDSLADIAQFLTAAGNVNLVYATYAAAQAGLPGRPPQLVQVTADETNGGQLTAYFWTGSALNWLPTVEG